MSGAREHLPGQRAIALVAGTLFGLGLALAGMTRPDKVRAFLDFTRAWDPSLMFVMVGAIAVHAVAYRLIARRASPLFAVRFALPTRKTLDARLLVGAAIFGVGWGLSGYCPGPAVAALVTGSSPVLAFVAAMLLGIAVAARVEALRSPASSRDSGV